MLICLEGMDGSGKSTQAERLYKRLGGHLVRFPSYDTLMGHLIEGHLKFYWSALPDRPNIAEANAKPLDTVMLNAAVFQALQLANRMEHASTLARYRAQGIDVVLDRYWPSGWVYGSADGLDEAWLLNIHRELPQPHLFILLDVPHGESSARRPERRDRYEARPALMERVGTLYRQLWRLMAHRHGSDTWAVINGTASVEEVSVKIWEAVKRARKVY